MASLSRVLVETDCATLQKNRPMTCPLTSAGWTEPKSSTLRFLNYTTPLNQSSSMDLIAPAEQDPVPGAETYIGRHRQSAADYAFPLDAV